MFLKTKSECYTCYACNIPHKQTSIKRIANVRKNVANQTNVYKNRNVKIKIDCILHYCNFFPRSTLVLGFLLQKQLCLKNKQKCNKTNICKNKQNMEPNKRNKHLLKK